MKEKAKNIFPYIFLILYALALPLIQMQISTAFTGFTGVFLVLAASLLSLRIGILAAVYTILTVTTVTVRSGSYALDALIGEALVYFAIAIGTGFVVEKYKESQTEMEKDIARRKEVEGRLKYLSFHDRLTGLYNRAYFDDALRRLDVNRQLPISIIMGDVNGLKIINDTFGHQAGDRLLIKAANILKQSCRSEEIICRWGGDEFLIILPGTDKDSAMRIYERIKEKCKAAVRENFSLSISLGVATKELEFKKIEDTLKEAEDRMYRDKMLRSKDTRMSIVGSLQALMEEKTEETIEHALRLQKYASEIGKKMNLSQNDIDELMLLSALHDIGKIAIPDNIIMKLDTLTPEEWEIMKKHSEIGHRITHSVPELIHISDKILYHHEWWDGSGYPRGLKGEEIPILSRIVAIADSYDVMTTGRPYKKLLSKDEAVAELKNCSGSHFDPHLVEIFLSILSSETLS
jgi:diguanylate cyclase (GGDEF)-like protein